jgi:hypothetical protein
MNTGATSQKSADLVFVHGLTGSAETTWARESGSACFWPRWLAEEMPHVNVWVLDYPAAAFWWAGSGTNMALPERARSVIDLLANRGLGRRPLAFIAHSLGGLLVKAILRAAQEFRQSDWRRLLDNTRGVVFLATPNTGSGLATIADGLRLLGFAQNATQLHSNEPHLQDLAIWYSQNANDLGIQTRAYYEKGRVKGIKIVDEGSADPRVPGCIPIPVDANHIEICKPLDRTDPVYSGILVFTTSLFGEYHVPRSEPSQWEAGQPAVDYNIDNVFGMQRGDTSHYIERSHVDDVFLNSLLGDKHVSIYGSSKQGKTTLRNKYLSKPEQLVVVCEREWSSTDIFAAILKAAGCMIDYSNPSSSPGLEVTVRIPKPTLSKDNAGASLAFPALSAGQFESVRINLRDTGDFVRVLRDVFFGKYLVLEEFHYLDEKTQRDFAYKLKLIHEISPYICIMVGVWLEKNKLAHLNENLAGRVVPINADAWTDTDLLLVIHGGEQKLNMKFPQGFAEDLVSRACGSVYLVRETCYRACMISGIFARVKDTQNIEKTLSVPGILKDISNGGVDYPGQIISLLGLDDMELNEQEREEDLRDWVLRTIVFSPWTELSKGISLKRLRIAIRETHPKKYNPTEGQIERIIRALQASQHTRAGYNLFDYDRQDKTIRCVDKGFILWRRNTPFKRIRNLMLEGEVAVA